MNTYQFYSDAGHGWLQVPTKLIKKLGIANKISQCSYVSPSGATVYLEEDCDAGLFIDALKAANIPFAFNEIMVNGYSHIRKYQNYSDAS